MRWRRLRKAMSSSRVLDRRTHPEGNLNLERHYALRSELGQSRVLGYQMLKLLKHGGGRREVCGACLIADSPFAGRSDVTADINLRPVIPHPAAPVAFRVRAEEDFGRVERDDGQRYRIPGAQLALQGRRLPDDHPIVLYGV
ncbi:hypothetical protein DFH08DRAFT_937536 [Mycena albidolilacea]|uniref:Uncharacterized protein n=1 Tax=Mycena albidolilacea TaxID=1033008 RepID=A0AAD7A0A1_9AGAR|nr:hypothetical protein DFH08DRAFT_937536 [Mycena albidolilacea]